MASNDANSMSYRGMSSDNIKGLVLALSSSFFIGASFIIKKKGLKKAGASGVRAGYSYLYATLVDRHDTKKDSMLWPYRETKLLDMIFDYVLLYYCKQILEVTLSKMYLWATLSRSPRPELFSGGISSCSKSAAVLAHVILRERLHIFGVLGCALCVVGSTTIVLHAPQEREIESVKEVWDLATEPAFVFYAVLVIATVLILIFRYVPQYGQTHIWFYIGVCSLVGSLSVMSVKALGIALKLTLSGMNQLTYPQTWVFATVVIVCVLTQMNYLNKALDTFNTAVVSPIYYVMFTSLTIVASVIMFKDWDRQNPTQIVTELCGFVTILSGTFLLHRTKDMTDGSHGSMVASRLQKHGSEDGFGDEGIPLRRQDSSRTP
ncbi:UNVERIFIED_CONTAM: putative magnesium transporter NIPA4 [Sesamum radiatum]|uniref:Probable magnesium transporter n=1 Tax=Sesamum radiatum TaxID=300843 RepID=A0AAW2U8T6_SESRA